MRVFPVLSTAILLLCALAGFSRPAPGGSRDCTASRLESRAGSQHVEIISNKPFVQVRFNDSHTKQDPSDSLGLSSSHIHDN